MRPVCSMPRSGFSGKAPGAPGSVLWYLGLGVLRSFFELKNKRAGWSIRTFQTGVVKCSVSWMSATLFSEPTDIPCHARPYLQRKINMRTIKVDISGPHTLWRTRDVSYNRSSGFPEIIMLCCNGRGRLC